jgi:PAS domain S-box-containing protein
MESAGQRPDRTLEALRERADKFQSIFENSTTGIFQSTLDGRFLMVNPAFAAILGYDSPADLIDSIGDIESQFYHHAERRAEILSAIQVKKGISRFDSTRIVYSEKLRRVQNEEYGDG